MSRILLSVLVVAHNEEDRIDACLRRLHFADEIVIILDRCTDGTKKIAEKYTGCIIEGSWEIEGERRNKGLSICSGDWILEVDCDEWISSELGMEILRLVKTSTFDWHEIPIDNYIGDRLVRYGWGGSFGTSLVPRLAKKGVKSWGSQSVHPSISLKGEKGQRLSERLIHRIDRNISDVIYRLDSYTSAKARDMRKSGQIGSTAANLRRFFSRFFKCYFFRSGYKEGLYGLLIAICAGLYPLLSYLKAKLEDD